MAKENVASTIEALVKPVVEELGFKVWDVEYKRIGADWNLTITIDSNTGVDLNACETVHRAIGTLLDEKDPIEDAYILNVSSPGIERELRTDEHILACIGEKCEIKLFAPLNGQKVIKGQLISFENGQVTIQTQTGMVVIDRASISKMHTVYFD